MKLLLPMLVWLLNSNPLPSLTFKIDPHTNDFKSLVLNNDLFVDKSLMIEEFVQMLPGCFVPLIIRPRGWGKSTNMDMLKRFYEIEVDDQGNRLPQSQTINDKLFLGGEILMDENSPPRKLNPLKISRLTDVNQYMGNMPVILLKLENVTGRCYEEIERSIKSRIVQAFQGHRYLLNHNISTAELFDENDLEKYFKDDFNTTDLKKSLHVLSGTLYHYFRRRRVVVLIDDYDAPLINAYLEFGHMPGELNKVVDLLDSMYQSALKGNIFLHKALVTGTLRISFDTINHPIARLDNLEICSFFNRRFPKHFGFTREEVKELLEKLPFSVDLDEMISWYGGYTIDKLTYLNSDLVMKSIAHNGSMGFYQQSNIVGEALLDKIFAIDKMQPKIQTLISGQKIYCNNFFLMMRLRWEVLQELVILVHYGYLNKTNSLLDPDLAVPNKQMLHIYKMKSLQWVATKFGVNSSDLTPFAECLSNGSMEQFGETLTTYLGKASQLIEAGEKQAKAVYNSMTIALQTVLMPSHEKIIGGPTDGFILIPKSGRGDMAIIFKYGIAQKQKDLVSVAKSSVDEINSHLNRTSMMKWSHIQKINKIGLAFCGIRVAVGYEIENISNFNDTEGVKVLYNKSQKQKSS